MKVARVAGAKPEWTGTRFRLGATLPSDGCRQWGLSCRGSVQLQQVVDRADHRPLLFHPLQAASQKLSEATRVFDLPEDRLRENLAPRVGGTTTDRQQLPRHPLLGRKILGRPAPWRRWQRVAVLAPLGGNERTQVTSYIPC